MDSYVLQIDDIRGSEGISIEESRYLKLCHSVSEINMCAQIEKKLDLLLDNYLDYQKEVLSLSLSNLVRDTFGNEDFESARPNLNRKLVNILTAAKLYVDQSSQELSSFY